MKRAPVLRRRFLGPDHFLLEVRAGELAKEARPGQFVMLRAWEGCDPLLPRPLSVHDVEGDRVSFLVQVRGRGTRLLSRLSAGDEVQYLGPLGRGFPEAPPGPVFLVAGGVGVAPLHFAARRLLARGLETVLLYGARSRGQILRLGALRRLGLRVLLATEDGSAGQRGLVTDLLRRLAPAQGSVFACGPLPMLRAVAELGARLGLAVHLSLEAPMACGLGLCLGCALKRRGGGYLHVCREGPVLPAEEVDLGSA